MTEWVNSKNGMWHFSLQTCTPLFLETFLNMHYFSVTWSFRNPYNMLIWCTRNIYYYYQCWKQLCCSTFPWICLDDFFRILWWQLCEKENLQHYKCIYWYLINLMHPWWSKVLFSLKIKWTDILSIKSLL